MQRFVDACHGLGLGVCLDVVYNHLGPVGNYLSRFGPYFSDRHPTPWGEGLNLDAEGSFHVRRWVVDNALRWFADFHIDALRLDAVHELHDDSDRHLLAQLSDEVKALGARLGRPLTLVAESDLNDAAMVTAVAEGGRGMDAQWDDDVHHALHVVLTGETQGYYSDFARSLPRSPGRGTAGGPGEDVDPRLPARRHVVELPRQRLGRPGRPGEGRRSSLPRLSADPRPGGQPCAG